MFHTPPFQDSITIQQLLVNAIRNQPQFAHRNDTWLKGRLTGLYYYKLVTPIYSFKPYRRLEKIALTSRGKDVLQ